MWYTRTYTQPSDIADKVSAYFEHCKEETTNNFANGVKFIKAPSKAGLARFLGIHRYTLDSYLKDKSYKDIQDILISALDEMEDWAISMGFSGSKFSEFYLKSTFSDRYTDKQIVEHQGSTMPQVSVQIDKDESKALAFDVGESIEGKNDA